MSYLVTAPLVVARTADGDAIYHYEGAIIADLDAANAEHLLESGLVVEVDQPVVVTDDEGHDGGHDPDGPPPKAATKEIWVEYAVSRAIAEGKDADTTRAQAEAMSKTELQAALSS